MEQRVSISEHFSKRVVGKWFGAERRRSRRSELAWELSHHQLNTLAAHIGHKEI